MKQLIQSYRTGELGLFDVPPPICGEGGILIRTSASLVSAGTEKMIVDLAKKSLIGKARARPDLVRQVIVKMRHEGVRNTLEKVFNKLDTPIPLGYSCAGKVVEAGWNVSGVSIGDRVACGGAGHACHSEINYIPKNLFVKIPDGMDDIDASFVTVGAIALQGVRQAGPALGERIAVIGLGLIGQLTVQLLKASGCLVLGADIDPDRLELARQLGADMVCAPGALAEVAIEFSRGFGMDSVIITASTTSSQPVMDAGEISKHKGRVVVVGMVGMEIPRNLYYKKELDIRLSMAYGPGRYDADYEEKGIDYPFPYVRWTEQRNFEAFLDLVGAGKVAPKKLITHRFEFGDALKAYDILEGKTREKYLGIVLEYKDKVLSKNKKSIELHQGRQASGEEGARVGLIGAGNFTKSVLLPNLRKIEGFDLENVCAATGISAQAVGKKYGFRHITTESEEIFNNERIDTVIITTRHNTHAPYVKKALNARKNVFVEKPLCMNMNELEDIKRLYSALWDQTEGAPILMVGFNRRFSPLLKAAKETIGGRPVSIVYRVNAGIVPRDHWIQDITIGGGRIVGEVCHFVDACSYLSGSLPSTVYARCIRKDDKSIPDEDNVSVILTFENGSIAAINYTAYGNRRMPKEHMEAFGDNMLIQMNDFREMVILRGNKTEKLRSSNQDKGFKGELEAFRDAVRTHIPPIGFDSLYRTTRAAFAMLESLRSLKAVRLDQ